jgi:hypothetical protein
MEIVLRLADVFRENLPMRKTQEKILRHILRLLKRIDRASFVLIDPETPETRLVEPFRISPAFAEAASRRQVLRISDFRLPGRLRRCVTTNVPPD